MIEGQVQIRGLMLGCDTPYRLVDFDPWSRQARADAGAGRAWNHGAWSGAEWLAETVVPIRVHLQAEGRDTAGWLALHQPLVAAFDPVGDAAEDVELRFALGEAEYVMFGRPRMVQVDGARARVQRGRADTQLAFVALDPRIYSGAEQTTVTTLPTYEGGLTVPLTAPFTVDGVLVGGREDLTNDGLADTPLSIRIDGPVVQPRVTLQRPDGVTQTLRALFDLADGQWLDIDTAAHTVFLNGVASRRGQVTGEFPTLPPGTSTLRFDAAEHNDDAELTARWRHAW